MVNIFQKLKEKKEEYKAKRLRYTEAHAEKLEMKAKYENTLASNIDRQQLAKAQIREAKRKQHPTLFKIGDAVKTKLAENKASKQRLKVKQPKNNIWAQQTDTKNIWTAKTSQQPYYLKTKTKKPYWLK